MLPNPWILDVAPVMRKGSNPCSSGGTFVFGGGELDLVEGGVFTGDIFEHDSKEGNSVGNLTEGWGGGEGPVVGGGKITTTKDKSPFKGGLGFGGFGANAGPLAGFQIGYVTGGGRWGGIYFEGHLGPFAFGGGGYCRVGG